MMTRETAVIIPTGIEIQNQGEVLKTITLPKSHDVPR